MKTLNLSVINAIIHLGINGDLKAILNTITVMSCFLAIVVMEFLKVGIAFITTDTRFIMIKEKLELTRENSLGLRNQECLRRKQIIIKQ